MINRIQEELKYNRNQALPGNTERQNVTEIYIILAAVTEINFLCAHKFLLKYFLDDAKLTYLSYSSLNRLLVIQSHIIDRQWYETEEHHILTFEKQFIISNELVNESISWSTEISNYFDNRLTVLVIFQAKKKNIFWFQPLPFYFGLYDNKLNILRF